LIALDQPPDAAPAAEKGAYFTAMAAEIEGQRKIAPHIVEPVGQHLADGAEQETVIGQGGSGTLAVGPDGVTIEDEGNAGHDGFMAWIGLSPKDPCFESRHLAAGRGLRLNGPMNISPNGNEDAPWQFENPWKAALGPVAGRALDLLFPPQCLRCRALTQAAGTLCPACWQGITFITEPQCAACGLPFPHDLGEGALCGACARQKPAFERARAVMIYDDFKMFVE
jgi:hypothetical protein